MGAGNSSTADADPAASPAEGGSEAAPAAAAPSAEAGAKPSPAEADAPETAAAEPAETSEPRAADADAKPKKKKKKRKREAPAQTRDPIGPDGSERPTFILDYPNDPELDRLVRAFELGNYAFVREHAAEVAQKSTDPRVRAAAAELARRIEPDPLVKTLLFMSLALFVVLAFWAYQTHGN
jgi:hypothetical protein